MVNATFPSAAAMDASGMPLNAAIDGIHPAAPGASGALEMDGEMLIHTFEGDRAPPIPGDGRQIGRGGSYPANCGEHYQRTHIVNCTETSGPTPRNLDGATAANHEKRGGQQQDRSEGTRLRSGQIVANHVHLANIHRASGRFQPRRC